MVQPKIRVQGLRDLNRDLQFFENGVGRSVRPVLLGFARRVQSRVIALYAVLYPNSFRSIAGIKATATQRQATIVLDGATFPALLGREFGSARFKQFPAWRGNGQDAGYFLFPTLREELPEMLDDLQDAIDELAAKAFPIGTVARARR